ncbi:hypothetical protein L211DRAFT_834443 [Terfezia boudieri ATCC MYA-4762]|uniref:Chaperone/heat shock protein Hsp12 n=1 Tax=Terfezia boudieri ATCC MYA-4762 TaxID=1051890 RepID=A0A3N4LXR1_9PEZI|nr:hypothetical protein L211DRAFT_834443 [Terfezia boudieri ATCC MYA-4762]
MSDTGRKSMTEQLGDKVKPDSQKSTTEHMGDKASGMMDRAAGSVQPESQKSTSQQMGESMRGSGGGKPMKDTIKDTVQSAKETMGMGEK